MNQWITTEEEELKKSGRKSTGKSDVNFLLPAEVGEAINILEEKGVNVGELLVEQSKKSNNHSDVEMSKPVENIGERIEELKLLRETRKDKVLTGKQETERLELMDHPFIRKLRGTFREYMWKLSTELGKAGYATVEKRKRLLFEDLRSEAKLYLEDPNDPTMNLDEAKKVFKAILEQPEGSERMVV